MSRPAPTSPPDSTPPQSCTGAPEQAAAQELAPEDFYFEGPYLVFTAAYLRKRGACCHSGCRHCPYGDSA